MNLKHELGKLSLLFSRGKKAYFEYQENGCTYLYAKILKKNNTCIVDLLISVYSDLPGSLQKDVLDLIFHIDVWTSLWECLEKEINPKAGDRFIFQNSVIYPKTAEDNLLSFYERLN